MHVYRIECIGSYSNTSVACLSLAAHFTGMIRHDHVLQTNWWSSPGGKGYQIPSGRVASDCFSCRLVSEHRCSIQWTSHGSMVGEEDTSSWLELPWLSDLSWKGVSTPQVGAENNPLVQVAVRAASPFLRRFWKWHQVLTQLPLRLGNKETAGKDHESNDAWMSRSSLLPSSFALAKWPFCNLSWKLLQKCMDLYSSPRLSNPSQGFGTLLVVGVIFYLNSFTALLRDSFVSMYGIALFHTAVWVPQETGHGQYSIFSFSHTLSGKSLAPQLFPPFAPKLLYQ